MNEQMNGSIIWRIQIYYQIENYSLKRSKVIANPYDIFPRSPLWGLDRFIVCTKYFEYLPCVIPFTYLFLERREGREGRERYINLWLPLEHPLLGTWLATQACALTGNQTSNPLICRLVLNPLSHTSVVTPFRINFFMCLGRTSSIRCFSIRAPHVLPLQVRDLRIF